MELCGYNHTIANHTKSDKSLDISSVSLLLFLSALWSCFGFRLGSCRLLASGGAFHWPGQARQPVGWWRHRVAQNDFSSLARTTRLFNPTSNLVSWAKDCRSSLLFSDLMGGWGVILIFKLARKFTYQFSEYFPKDTKPRDVKLRWTAVSAWSVSSSL